MISVIVPVYNVEPYLRKCLDSIVAQTYTDLEILVIDDGSTDRCGEICDSYAERDPRIRVFHTENRGLSAARNLGLDNARGEYIGFVDSDDWIEPDMYEYLAQVVEQKRADVVECGEFLEYPGKTIEKKRILCGEYDEDIIPLYIKGVITTTVWNKLWNRKCFDNIRFPNNRIYEDIATTYRVLASAERIHVLAESKYHYRRREGSLSKVRDLKNIEDYWLSHKEKFDNLSNQVNESARNNLLKSCARAAARAWALYDECTDGERGNYDTVIRDIHSFTKENIPLFGLKEWSLTMRIGVFFPHFLNVVSFRLAWLIFKLNKNSIIMDYKLTQQQLQRFQMKRRKASFH